MVKEEENGFDGSTGPDGSTIGLGIRVKTAIAAPKIVAVPRIKPISGIRFLVCIAVIFRLLIFRLDPGGPPGIPSLASRCVGAKAWLLEYTFDYRSILSVDSREGSNNLN